MTIYDRIRKRRDELGMSQQELADKTGYKSRSAINKIELGLRDISQSKIESFANALQTTPAYLMGWEDELSKSDNSPDESFYDYYTKARKSKGAVMFRGGDSGSDPFYMSAEEAADAEAYIRTRRKMQEEQGK